jgi:hypothetical protein
MEEVKPLDSLLNRFEASINDPLDAVTWESVKKAVPKQVEAHVAQGGALEDILGKLIERQAKIQSNPVIQGLLGATEAWQGKEPGSLTQKGNDDLLKQLLTASQIRQNQQKGSMQNLTPEQLGTMINAYNEKLPKGYNAALSAEGRITASKTGQTLAEEKFDVLLKEKEDAKKLAGALVNQSATDTLDTISKIEENMNLFGFTGSIPPIPGTPKYVWSTYVNKLTASKIIDLITEMKKASKTGATGFGQLSEKEGQILKDSATALRKSLPPEEAQRILNRMKPLLNKVVSGGQTEQQQSGNQTFNIGGKVYNIPIDKIEAFKKAKGIQ